MIGKLIGKTIAEVVKTPIEIAEELGKALDPDPPKKPKK